MTTQYTLSPTEEKQWLSDPELPKSLIKGESARRITRDYAKYRASIFNQSSIDIVKLDGELLETVLV